MPDRAEILSDLELATAKILEAVKLMATQMPESDLKNEVMELLKGAHGHLIGERDRAHAVIQSDPMLRGGGFQKTVKSHMRPTPKGEDSY